MFKKEWIEAAETQKVAFTLCIKFLGDEISSVNYVPFCSVMSCNS
jgi:hypothetical protein